MFSGFGFELFLPIEIKFANGFVEVSPNLLLVGKKS